ncbi:SDR family NAD(P)-dependent oxidoreductase [Patescibacteria group bacterium]|nr:SDR family NAD(P)-dependent oxidoreductase [Patescibacteria group bacterium]
MSSILITGAARGIGKDAAFALAKRGHHVVATAHIPEQAEALRLLAEAENIKLQVAAFDITQESDEARIFSDHSFDVLINNAAVGESGPMSEVPLEIVRAGFEVNVFSTLRLTQAFIRQLQNNAGAVITLSSVAGRIVLPHLGPYHMTKFALEAMHDALRMEMRPHNVRVHLIEPGYIATGFNERMYANKWRWLLPTSRFAADFDRLKKFERDLPNKEVPTTSVVEAIVRAVEDAKTPARLLAPASASWIPVVTKLVPTWLLDRIMRKAAGL